MKGRNALMRGDHLTYITVNLVIGEHIGMQELSSVLVRSDDSKFLILEKRDGGIWVVKIVVVIENSIEGILIDIPSARPWLFS
jgi:hypothetical protein